jgi:hypothetical protein
MQAQAVDTTATLSARYMYLVTTIACRETVCDLKAALHSLVQHIELCAHILVFVIDWLSVGITPKPCAACQQPDAELCPVQGPTLSHL